MEMIRLPELLRRQGRDKMGEQDREVEQKGDGDNVTGKKMLERRPWKMFNIYAGCQSFSVCYG